MLNAQEAQERLKTFLIPDGQEKRLAAVKALEPKLRQMALSYMDCDEEGRQTHLSPEKERDVLMARHAEAKTEIRPTLTPEEHRRVFGTIFPDLRELLTYAWETQRTEWSLDWPNGNQGWGPPKNADWANKSFDEWVKYLLWDCPPTYPTRMEWLADWTAIVSVYRPYGGRGCWP